MVEMALMAPLFFVFVFGIADLAYYVWGYSSIYNAARVAADFATTNPPQVDTLALANPSNPKHNLYDTDPCVRDILAIAENTPSSFPVTHSDVIIRYPSADGRLVGAPIEVLITHEIEPLTPLLSFIGTSAFGNNGKFTVEARIQRSIESLAADQSAAKGSSCYKAADLPPANPN